MRTGLETRAGYETTRTKFEISHVHSRQWHATSWNNFETRASDAEIESSKRPGNIALVENRNPFNDTSIPVPFFSTFSTYTVRCPFPLRSFSFGIILSFRSEKSLGRSRKCSLDMRMDMMRITCRIRIHVLAYNVSARRRIRVRWTSTSVSVYVNACVHCGLVQHTSVWHGFLEGASLEDRNALLPPATSLRLLQPFSAASRQKIQTFFRVYQLCL